MSKTEIMDRLAAIDAKHARRDELMHDLRRSVALQELWPEAFTDSVGPATSRVNTGAHGAHYFTIKNARGDSKVFPLEDVPQILWPANLPLTWLRLKLGSLGARRYIRDHT